MEVTQHVGKDQLNPLWVICSKLCMISGAILDIYLEEIDVLAHQYWQLK